MEVNLVLLVVSYILSISALTLACINMTNDAIWLTYSENIIYKPLIEHEIPEQDFVEMILSSRNAREFNRKLKKYINTERMDAK